MEYTNRTKPRLNDSTTHLGYTGHEIGAQWQYTMSLTALVHAAPAGGATGVRELDN
jgi:hypothetical protein